MTETFPGFDGAALALHRLGEGPAVILLHGLFSSAHMNWIKFGHARRIADRGYEVLMPDLRAHAGSAAPHEATAYPPDVLVRDLVALVEDLKLSQFDLGGFSLGARTVLHAVAKGAVQPNRLVVGGMGSAGLSDWTARAAHFTRLIDRFDSITRDDPAWLAAQFMKSQKVDRVAVRLLLGTFTDLPLQSLGAITCPTMVVCGDDDEDNGSAVDLAERIPNAIHRTVPGTHMGSVTQAELGATIAEWLGPA